MKGGEAVTSREKKAVLKGYCICIREAQRLEEEIRRWDAVATKVTTEASGMPKAQGGADRIQSAVEHIVELQQELTAQMETQVDLRRHIEDAIRTVGDARLQLLLRYRYIDGWTWERIAVETCTDYRWILRLHGKALEKLTIESHY